MEGLHFLLWRIGAKCSQWISWLQAHAPPTLHCLFVPAPWKLTHFTPPTFTDEKLCTFSYTLHPSKLTPPREGLKKYIKNTAANTLPMITIVHLAEFPANCLTEGHWPWTVYQWTQKWPGSGLACTPLANTCYSHLNMQ